MISEQRYRALQKEMSPNYPVYVALTATRLSFSRCIAQSRMLLTCKTFLVSYWKYRVLFSTCPLYHGVSVSTTQCVSRTGSIVQQSWRILFHKQNNTKNLGILFLKDREKFCSMFFSIMIFFLRKEGYSIVLDSLELIMAANSRWLSWLCLWSVGYRCETLQPVW